MRTYPLTLSVCLEDEEPDDNPGYQLNIHYTVAGPFPATEFEDYEPISITIEATSGPAAILWNKLSVDQITKIEEMILAELNDE